MTSLSDGPQAPEKAALVISIQSWATPIVGVVMLILGLLGGYFGRPLLAGKAAASPADVLPAASQETEAAPAVSEAQKQAMQTLISQTRHFTGNPDAPVTILEFSDFQ